jgi:hypothetical protein
MNFHDLLRILISFLIRLLDVFARVKIYHSSRDWLANDSIHSFTPLDLITIAHLGCGAIRSDLRHAFVGLR